MAHCILESTCKTREGVLMTSPLTTAIQLLQRKLDPNFSHRVKFVIPDHGTIMVNDGRVYEGSGQTDCTLTASLETYRRLVVGELDPVAAYVSGEIQVEGSAGIAMELSAFL